MAFLSLKEQPRFDSRLRFVQGKNHFLFALLSVSKISRIHKSFYESQNKLNEEREHEKHENLHDPRVLVNETPGRHRARVNRLGLRRPTNPYHAPLVDFRGADGAVRAVPRPLLHAALAEHVAASGDDRVDEVRAAEAAEERAHLRHLVRHDEAAVIQLLAERLDLLLAKVFRGVVDERDRVKCLWPLPGGLRQFVLDF